MLKEDLFMQERFFAGEQWKLKYDPVEGNVQG